MCVPISSCSTSVRSLVLELLLVGVVRVMSMVFLVLIHGILILECVFFVLRLMEDTSNDNNNKIYA